MQDDEFHQPLVLTRAPTARDSRQGMPPARTQAALTRNLLATAISRISPHSNHAWAVQGQDSTA
jgi:hypothetical protein